VFKMHFPDGHTERWVNDDIMPQLQAMVILRPLGQPPTGTHGS
jgi:hypothetical protein